MTSLIDQLVSSSPDRCICFDNNPNAQRCTAGDEIPVNSNSSKCTDEPSGYDLIHAAVLTLTMSLLHTDPQGTNSR
jgi:hypothetical protein